MIAAVLATPLLLVTLHPTATATTPAEYRGHGAASVPPELLARYAPKAVDAELRRKIQAYLDVRSPSAGLLAPDGQRLFFTWNITGISQVWRLDGPMRFPVQLTGGEDDTSVVAITADGKWLILSRDRKGEENPGLYLQSPEGGPLVTVQHQEGVQTFFQWASPDARYVWYSANDVEPQSYALYRYDLTTRAAERMFAEKGLWRIADVRDDGLMLLARSVGSRRTEFHTWNATTGARAAVLDDKEEYSARFAPSGDDLFVLTPRFGEFRRLYRRHLGEYQPVTPERAMDVTGFQLDLPRQRLIATVNDGGLLRLEAYDAATLGPLSLPTVAGAEELTAGATTHDGRFTTLTAMSSTAPRTSWVWDWQQQTLTRWLTPNAPEVDTATFAVTSIESYPARDGTAIPMLVRRPARCASELCPVVVQFHGGPEGQARPGFDPRAQLYVDQGFILVEPNVRGSDGYGKSWFHADDGRKRLDVITDIADAAIYIRKAWARDGKAPKIAVIGGSYGGYSALIGMTMFGGTYDVGVSIVGISNLLTFLRNTAPYRRILRTSEYGDPETDAEALVTLSPVTYLDRVQGPLLLIQGASDPRVPVGEALQMRDALAARNLPVELAIFADEGHGAKKRDNQVLQLGHTLAFLRQHLLAEK